MIRLIPRETKFFRMFAEVSQNLTEGARLLQDILKSPANMGERLDRLQEIEHRGDDMTHSIITTLNQTFITPFDREDIHRLTSSLDDVLDFVNSAGVRLRLYRIDVPPPIAAELAGLIVQQSEELAKGVSLLEQNRRVLEHCVEVHRLENEEAQTGILFLWGRRKIARPNFDNATGVAVFDRLFECRSCGSFNDYASRPRTFAERSSCRCCFSARCDAVVVSRDRSGAGGSRYIAGNQNRERLQPFDCA